MALEDSFSAIRKLLDIQQRNIPDAALDTKIYACQKLSRNES